MKFHAKTICALLAAALLLGLAACNDTSGDPSASVPPASTPGTGASSGNPQSEDSLLSGKEVDNHVPTVPLDGAPEFLTREQQQLYLDAYAMYTTNFEPSAGTGMMGQGEGELREVDGYLYRKAEGAYAKWDDFWAALTALFTQEYAEELIAPVNSVPRFENLEGETWFLDGARGEHVEWVGPDTFLEGDADDDIIEFYVVGHYEKLDSGEAYEESFPLTLMKTADGWRFSQFHITF